MGKLGEGDPGGRRDQSGRIIREPGSSLKELRERAIRAARTLMLQDVSLFASLGHVADVSAEPTGAPLVDGSYNIRLPLEAMNPAAMARVKVIYLGCADKRLTEAQAQIADELTGGDRSQVLPVLLAGGAVQPGPEEVDAEHLNTALVSHTPREPLVWDIMDYLVAERLEQNPDEPLTVIYGAHDGRCAFLAEIFNGSLVAKVSPDIVQETQIVHSADDAESALVMNTIVSHASDHQLPNGVTRELRLFSLTPTQDGGWNLVTRPITTGSTTVRRRLAHLRPGTQL